MVAPPDLVDYEETHTVTRSFSHTITLDESGDASSGIFTLDIVGEAHYIDVASGSNDTILTASGTLASHVSYHSVLQGHFSSVGFTVDTQSYTETGSNSSVWSIEYHSSMMGDFAIESNYASSWSLSWSASFVNEVQTVDSFAYVDGWQHTWHSFRGFLDGSTVDEDVTAGAQATGNSTEDTSYTGSSWWDEHIHNTFPNPGGEPFETFFDTSWNNPLSGTVTIPTDAAKDQLEWRAEHPTATNFTFHGVMQLGGTLDLDATWTSQGLDINSFSSTSIDSASGHVVEVEPSPPISGGGQESYHRDQAYFAATSASGTGSVLGGVYAADFQVIEEGTENSANELTVDAVHSSDIDEVGDAFDLLFSHTSEATTSGGWQNTFNYHDADDGTRLIDSYYSGGESSASATHSWGVRNGVSFDESSSQSGGDSSSFSIQGTGRLFESHLLVQNYPFRHVENAGLLLAYNSARPVAPLAGNVFAQKGLPKSFYERKIKEIGENAKLKVGHLGVRRLVMGEISTNPKHSATFTFDGEGVNTLAAAMGHADALQKVQKDAEAAAEGTYKLSAFTINTDVQATFHVEPAPGQNQSGKCVVEYRFRITIQGTDGAGRPRTISYSGTAVGGGMWFIDDNLKTTDLAP